MNAPRSVVFIGVSNLLSDFIDCALVLGHRVAGIVMNQPEAVRPGTLGVAQRIAGLGLELPLIPIEDFTPAAGTLIALGTTAAGRDRLVEHCRQRWNLQFGALVHPRACVSAFASIGEGAFVGAGSVVAPGARLGKFVFLNRGATIGHDAQIGDYARLMPGCNIGGHVVVGGGATIGMGANVIEELEIGAGAYVAAGATVIDDVPERAFVAGVPATVKKILP